MLKFLLELAIESANEIDEHGYTPILWAASYGQITSINRLVKAGAQATFRGPLNATALMFAANKGHSHVVKMLIQLKIDVNLFDDVSCFTFRIH